VDGICTVCGEKDQPMIQWAGSNVTLGGALALNFAFDTNQLNGTTGNYIVLTRSYADGRADDIVTIPQSEWVSAGGSYIQVSYTNMAAKEMGDKITAVVYNADGKVISETRTDSMAEYSARMLVRADIVASAEKRTLFVDMLNYGAAAQVYFQYNEKNLVNAGLTEEQAGWASAKVQISNYRETSGCYFGSSLSLEEEIYLQVAFGTAYEEGMYATVSFTDHYGKLVEKRVAVAASGSYSVVQVEGMAIADYRGLVTCKLYSAAGAELGSVTDSIESYACRMAIDLQKNGVDLGDAIMKLGASSYEFFH
jgi:YD repeat-containing protein